MNPTSIIIPAYNEEASIVEVIARVRNVLGSQCEIIVVNDGSTDRTGALAAAAGARVLTNPTNVGYGFSLKRGFQAASHDCAIITDGDGTYPVESLPKLLAEYERGIDMVVGARQGKTYWSGAAKTIARYCFKWMSEYVVGARIPDINSGLRVIRRSKILPLLPELSNAFSFTTSATLLFFLKHYFVSYIPIEYQERQGKSKVRYIRDALRTMQIMVDIIAKYNPIKLFLLLSLFPLASATAGLIGLVVFRQYGWLELSILSTFIGLLIISLGCLATIFRKTS